ncbi:hypothetical protein CJ030_MR1G016571 [Morella rubra]|uniref:Reverse transcriptase Ty1/copia-type domain-containing protein n=1 Tax=Morella rubra TaxID=262757 RepID=A0A6A1WMN6_9ROSI|nr:hypothetical protein CJ030_MR1G016571 [Morella rubra]
MPSSDYDQSLNDNEIIGDTEVRKVRGGTRMTDVWNLGDEGGILFNKFTGCVAHRSHAGKQNRLLQTTIHTTGSKSFARYAHELEKEKQVPINRADLYKTVHMRSDGSPINPDVAEKILLSISKPKVMLILLLFHDLIYTGNNEKMLQELKEDMMKTFETSDLDLMYYFLGIEISQEEERIFIYQKKYTENLLKRFNMYRCKYVTTPQTRS